MKMAKRVFSKALPDEVASIRKVAKIREMTSVFLPDFPVDLLEKHSSLFPSEESLGLGRFLRSGIPFTGIVKSRYSDFIVHEIDSDKQIVRLTNVNLPADEEPRQVSDEEKKLEQIDNQSKFESGLIELNRIFGNETVENFLIWFRNDENKRNKCFFAFPPQNDKEARRSVHQIFKELITSLVSDFNDGSIRVRYLGKNEKPVTRGQQAFLSQMRYLKFALYKENRDTMTAIGTIARQLRCKPHAFAFAGTKDRRAQTTQWLTCNTKDLTAKRLLSAVDRIRELKVGNFAWVERPVHLGDLRGNHFQIVLREVTACQPDIECAAQQILQNGFVNYFGLQRFGTGDISTHQIGLALMRRDFTLAVQLILAPRSNEDEESNAARRKLMETRNVRVALDEFSNHMHAERALLTHFLTHDVSNMLGALQSLPRYILHLYLHAYQSYLWNHVCTARMNMNAQHPVCETCIVGDLVYETPVDDIDFDPESPIDEEAVAPIDADATTATDAADSSASASSTSTFDGASASSASASVSASASAAEIGSIEAANQAVEAALAAGLRPLPRVRLVTEADVACGRYTLADVLLPIPGTCVALPTHGARESLVQWLARDGLQLDAFAATARIKSLAMTGSYRRIISNPADFAWKIVKYDDPTFALTVSDIDVLQKKPEPKTSPDGKFTAAVVEFSLSSSCYATMLLRELFRQPIEKKVY